MDALVFKKSVDTILTVQAAVAKQIPDILGLIDDLVSIDSGPDHPTGVYKVLEKLAQRLEILGAQIEWREEGGVSHFRACLRRGCNRVVLLGHADTVFERNTTQTRPFRVEGSVAYGPGIVDMKGCLVMGLVVMEQLIVSSGLYPSLDFIIVGDEETRNTHPPFMDELVSSDACLVLECGRPGGGFVVSRKGGLRARLVASGMAAHAGTEPELGSSAVLALCQEVLRVSEIDRSRPDLSLVVGKIAGGTAVNVVPEWAEASLDIRSPNEHDLDWAAEEIRRFGEHRGVHLRLETTGTWPPMRPSANKELVEMYESLAKATGIPVQAISTGGASDACWISEAGVPTLDGLGPIGGLDHGPNEFMNVETLPDRAGLLAGLLVAIEEKGRL